MDEKELKALAAKEGISVEELKALLAKGKLQTSSLRLLLAKQEAFMGKSLKRNSNLRTVNATKESAEAHNKKVRDYQEHANEQSRRINQRNKAKELQQTNDMVASMHSGTDRVARVAAPVLMAAATAGLAPAYLAVASLVPAALNYIRNGWQLWNATHPTASMVLNAAGTGLAIGALADPETGALKTITALLDGRYGDAALSGVGDAWNAYVAANGLYNFGNLVYLLMSLVPNLLWPSFSGPYLFRLPYAARPYGIPLYLPESGVPGPATVTRPMLYTPPLRLTGLNGYDGLFLWRATTLPPPVRTTGQAAPGGFRTSVRTVPEVVPVLPYGSTLLPVPGIPSYTATSSIPNGPYFPPLLPPPYVETPLEKWSIQQSWGSPAYLEYFRNLPDSMKVYGNGSMVNVLHTLGGQPTVRSAGYGVWDPAMGDGEAYTTTEETPNYTIDALDKKNWYSLPYKGNRNIDK